MTFQPPTPPAAVFGDAVQLSDAQLFMGRGNPPLYVSSVSYGRRLLFLISSKEDSDEVDATLFMPNLVFSPVTRVSF